MHDVLIELSSLRPSKHGVLQTEESSYANICGNVLFFEILACQIRLTKEPGTKLCSQACMVSVVRRANKTVRVPVQPTALNQPVLHSDIIFHEIFIFNRVMRRASAQ